MYLRLKDGQEWDELRTALVEDCAQLTKANSIEGTLGRGEGSWQARGHRVGPATDLHESRATGNKRVRDSIPAISKPSSELRKSLALKDNVTVIYTPWSNLKKDGSMAVGQVGFTNPKLVRTQLFSTLWHDSQDSRAMATLSLSQCIGPNLTKPANT